MNTEFNRQTLPLVPSLCLKPHNFSLRKTKAPSCNEAPRESEITTARLKFKSR
jgi:hypothetical protein